MNGVVYTSTEAMFIGTSRSIAPLLAKKRNLLKPSFSIFTREKITSDYLSLRFAQNGIPSLAANILPYRQSVALFCDTTQIELVSDETSVCLIDYLLRQQSSLSPRARLRLAVRIFAAWEQSLFSGLAVEERPELFGKFCKAKAAKKTRAESLLYVAEKNLLLPPPAIRETAGEKIIVYAIDEMEPVYFEILKRISQHVDTEFCFVAAKAPSEPQVKSIADLPKQRLLKQMQAEGFALLMDEAPRQKPAIRFLKAREKYREIEYIARDILKKISDNEGLSLNAIKVCLPVKNEEYFTLIKSIFGRFNIPVAMTVDLSWKTSSFFAAFQSVVALLGSDYNVEKVFRLLQNPSFNPAFLSAKPDINFWRELASLTGVVGWLDRIQKKAAGIVEDRYLAWEDCFAKIAEWQAGIDDMPAVSPDGGEQAEAFATTVSSLLHDLEELQGNSLRMVEKIRLLGVILDVYLEDDNSKSGMIIKNTLQKLENAFSCLQQMDIRHDDAGISEYLAEFLGKTNIGSSGILKRGVVVGTIHDTTDPSFDYIYCPGLDENSLPDYSVSSPGKEEQKKESEQNALRSRISFYHIFRQNAKEVILSYVSLDTTRDRPYFPSSEYLFLQNLKPCSQENIPLFGDEEVRQNNLLWENRVLEMHHLQFLENHPLRKSRIPVLAREINSDLYADYASLRFYESIQEYMFRKPTGPVKLAAGEFTLHQFADWLVCPAKHYASRVLSLATEQELNSDSFGISPLLRSGLLKDVMRYYFNPEQKAPQVFTEDNFRKGIVPTGMIGAVQQAKWQEKTDKLATELARCGFSVLLQGLRFGEEELDNTGQTIVYPGPVWRGRQIFARADLLLLREGQVFLCNLAASASLNPRDIFNTCLTVLFLNNNSEGRKLAGRLSPDAKIEPLVIHYDYSSSRLSIREFPLPEEVDDGVLGELADLYTGGFFPYTPLEEQGELKVCSNCSLQSVCFACRYSQFEGEPEKTSELFRHLQGQPDA